MLWPYLHLLYRPKNRVRILADPNLNSDSSSRSSTITSTSSSGSGSGSGSGSSNLFFSNSVSQF